MSNNVIALENQYCAPNYAPLPVVLTRGEGVYLWDDQGRRYIDMLGAYSAMSHGHAHPRLVEALTQQAQILSVPSRAFHSDKLALFLEHACRLTGQEMALPMSTGTEAVETAIKAARKWGYEIKGIPAGKAEIIVCDGNFHGRTIAAVGMSSDPQYRDGFGPFPDGFKTIPFGDATALQSAITPNTAAFLVEPIQGEGGIIVPPKDYLARCLRICRAHKVLLICDEIQTGLGRTGKLLASYHDDVTPHALILGKALGGGLLPVSLFLARREIMQVFRPGDHGSTFGGSALAAAVGLEALSVLTEAGLVHQSASLGKHLLDRLRALSHPAIRDVRGLGLFAGVEFDPDMISAHDMSLRLMERGVLTKETRRNTIRFAPPLIITQEELDWAIDRFEEALNDSGSRAATPGDPAAEYDPVSEDEAVPMLVPEWEKILGPSADDEPESYPMPEPDLDQEPDFDPAPEPESEPLPEPVSGLGYAPSADAGPDSSPEPRPDPDFDPVPEPEWAQMPEPSADPGRAREPSADAEPESDLEPAPVSRF